MLTQDDVSIFLVDTATDEVITTIAPGVAVDPSLVSGRTVGIYAEVNDPAVSVGSARLSLNGSPPRIENVSPYALFGDIDGDFLSGTTLADGAHSLALSFHGGSGASGELLLDLTVDFQVAASLPSVFSVGPTALAQSEGDAGTTTYVFEVSRTGDLAEPASVQWSVAGSGTHGADTDDFAGGVMPSGSVTFEPGESVQQVLIEVAGDVQVEADETFTIALHSPSDGAQIDVATAVGTITNDDQGPPTLSIGPAQVSRNEGADGVETVFEFSVSRVGTLAGVSTVDWQVTPAGINPADASDFGGALASGSLQFDAGQDSQLIQVTVTGDDLIEQTETFEVLLLNPDASTVIAQSTTTGEIVNDDFPPPPGLSIGPAQLDQPEGNDGPTTYSYTVTRTGDLSVSSSVDWSVAGVGVAGADAADFGGVLPTGALTFLPGDTEQFISFVVTGDTDFEADEAFEVLLGAAVNATVNVGSAGGLIENDDPVPPPELSIGPAAVSQDEGNTGLTEFSYTVTRTGDLSGTNTVDWMVSGAGSNAVDADDFGGELPSGSLVFDPGVQTQTLSVLVSGDTELEADETFEVSLVNGDPNVVISGAAAQGVVVDDDNLAPSFLSIQTEPVFALESATDPVDLSFLVTRSGDLDNTVGVDWAVEVLPDQSASAADFVGGQLPSGTLAFAPGETQQTITVSVLPDQLVEADETFSVVLANATLGTTITNDTGTGVIYDETLPPTFDPATDVIALHYDNAPDPDDGHATVAGRVLSDTFGFTPIVVNGTAGFDVVDLYNPASEAVFDAAWGTSWIDAMADRDGALATVSAAWSQTISDGGRVWVAEGGPSDFTADALELLPAEQRASVIVVQHSVWNEDHTEPSRLEYVQQHAIYLKIPDGNDPGPTADLHMPSPAFVDDALASPWADAWQAAFDFLDPINHKLDFSDTVELLHIFNVPLSVVSDVDDFANEYLDVAGVQLGPVLQSADEGDTGTTDFTFSLERTGQLDQVSAINWQVVPLDTDADDFGGELPNGTVIFEPGMQTQTISVSVSGDLAVEADETFGIEIASGGPGTVILPGSAVAVIVNDDVAPVAPAELAIGPVSIDQGEGNGGLTDYVYTVTRSGNTDIATSVDWAVTGVGADVADATDFAGGVLPSGTVSFAAGEISADITIQVNGDTEVEPDELFDVTLSNAGADTVMTTAMSTGAIRNDDVQVVLPELGIDPASVSVAEGDTGPAEVSYAVTRSGDLSGVSTVQWTVGGTGVSPTDAADFVGGNLPVGELTFLSGENTQTITFQVNGDTDAEPDETFEVVLGNAVDAQIVVGTATGLIINDDVAPVVPAELAIGPVSIDQAEGSSGLTDYVYTVTRSGNTDIATSVEWAVTGVGADAADATDFAGGVLPSGTVTFAAGETSADITIQVNGDTDVEPDDTFDVTLSNPGTDTVIVTAVSAGTIQNDDAAAALPDISIDTASAQAVEGDTGTVDLTYMVSRSGDLSGVSTVQWTVGGTGAAPADAADFAGGTLPTGELTFLSGESTQTITVQVAGDTDIELDETFEVILDNAVDAQIVVGTADGQITNDDVGPAVLQIGPAVISQAEGDSGITEYVYTVTRSGKTNNATSVDWVVTGSGTDAADGLDFAGGALPSGAVNFAAGQTSQDITIQVSGDADIEPDESFEVTLTNARANTVIATAVSAGTIENDDTPVVLPELGIGPASVELPEGDTGPAEVNYTVTRSGDLSGVSTVQWTVSGSGVAPVDAADFVGGVLPGGELTFLSGESTQTIVFQVSGDTDIEPDETFEVALGNAVDAQITTGVATGLVTNDDVESAVIDIGPSAIDQAEGDSATTDYVYTVTRSGNTDIATSVDWAVTGSGADPADATDFAGGVLPSGTVALAAGETSADITIRVNGDADIEPDESFSVTLSNAGADAVIATAVSAGTIENDDLPVIPPDLGIETANVQVVEGDAGSTEVSYTVTRSGDLSGVSTVQWTVNGSGAAPADAADFVGGLLPGGELTFLSGESTQTIVFQVSGDTDIEPDETFEVVLGNAVDAQIVTGTATGLIANDDAPNPTVISLVTDSVVSDEGNSGTTSMVFDLAREGDLSGTSTVSWAVGGTGSDPAAADDFLNGVLPSGDVVFAPGQEQASITVNVNGDDQVESDEAFQLMLSSVQPDGSIDVSTATGTILNDDVEPTSIGSVYLVDTQTDEVIQQVTQNATVSGSLLSNHASVGLFALVDDPVADVESALLVLDGDGPSRMENVSPYALFGDIFGNFLTGTTFAPGDHSFSVSFYSGDSGTGVLVEQTTWNFTVTDDLG